MHVSAKAEDGVGGTAIEPDLPTLACDAAVEIDDLVRGHQRDLAAVRLLAATIADSVKVEELTSPASLLHPATAIMLGRAIGSVPGGAGEPRKLNELLKTAGEYVRSLTRLVEATEASPPSRDELTKLRAFCVALSTHAGATHRSPFDRPQHPLRRS
jgi:hypothetical protein